MTEPQIIKLQKQIQLLNQYNTELKIQLEEQSIQLGEMRKKYDQVSSEYQNQYNQNNIINNKENIQKLLENALLEEKHQINTFKDSNSQLIEKINLYEKIIKEKDLYIDKLILENNNLKRDLIKCSNNNNNTYDYFEQKKKQQEIENLNIINDKKNLLNNFNILCEQMENIIRENRVLRQMADVPENFGIDLNKIKIGEKITIEDYKKKIRLLIQDIDELEIERAKLKHNIYFLASSFQLNEPPFHLLSKEQKVELAFYAQKLYEGKNNNNTNIEENNKTYDELKKIIEDKNKYIKQLENEIETKKVNERNRTPSMDVIRNNNFNYNYNNRNNNRYNEDEINNNINNNDNCNDKQMSEIINLLKEQKEEFKRILNNKRNQNNGNVYNIFHYNNNFFVNPKNESGFKNYIGNGYKIIRRSIGK